jgi:hypothetical protein
MLTPRRKRELLLQVEAYATRLAAAEVGRSELMASLNVLFLPGDPWEKRLARARELAQVLPESWVAERSGQTRPQLGNVRAVLREIFAARLEAEELRFLLGWLVRDIAIREKARREARQEARRRNEGGPGVGRTGPRR